MKLIIVPVPLTHEKSLSQTQMRFFFLLFFVSLMCLQSCNWVSFVILQNLLFPHVWHHSVYKH